MFTRATKIIGSERILDAKRHARKLGWNSNFSEALTTVADRGSGGCAVEARKGIGLSSTTNCAERNKLTHRFCHTWVSGVVKGGLHCISVYAKDKIGPTGENLELLEELTALVRSIDGPWVIAGDWNMIPEALTAAGWPRIVNGTVVATLLPT